MNLREPSWLMYKKICLVSSTNKKVQEGSRRFTEVHEGSREGSRRLTKAHEGSRRFTKVLSLHQYILAALLKYFFFHNSTLISATELSLRQERVATSTLIFASSHSNPSLLDGSCEGFKFPRKSEKTLKL